MVGLSGKRMRDVLVVGLAIALPPSDHLWPLETGVRSLTKPLSPLLILTRQTNTNVGRAQRADVLLPLTTEHRLLFYMMNESPQFVDTQQVIYCVQLMFIVVCLVSNSAWWGLRSIHVE